MKTTISNSDFHDAFNDSRPNHFSYDGLNALFNYLEGYEDLMGEEIDLDVIGLCVEYTEYDSLEEYNQNYEPVKSIEEIEELTTIIPIDDDRFIIQNY